jgi:RecB family exonuclease
VITPRRTRLVRVADLHEFRRVLAQLACHDNPAADRAVAIVPTRAAGEALGGSLAHLACSMWGPAAVGPLCVTRDRFYDVLRSRLPQAPRSLTACERDAIAQAAAHEAAASGDVPFEIRPGLVAELLQFYDHLRRQGQQVKRFEELLIEAIGGHDTQDRGALRLLRQTRFLAGAFRAYERRVAATGACDEHGLRDRLVEAIGVAPRHVVVTVPDWIADPAGLYVADFDLLARLPGLEQIDIVSTEGTLASGFHQRLREWWPGVDETSTATILGSAAPVRPRLVVPRGDDGETLWFVHRDREEELAAVARQLRADGLPEDPAEWSRCAVVYKHPLPYLYLAPLTLGAAGIPFQTADALPLAAEPIVATIDLVLDAVETGFARTSLVALLRSPHLHFDRGASESGGEPLAAVDARTVRESAAVMNRWLSDERYLGGRERLDMLAQSEKAPAAARAALQIGAAIARRLAPLAESHPASLQLALVLEFLKEHFAPSDAAVPLAGREARARDAVVRILEDLESAHAAHHDPEWTIDELATAVRRWIGEETFLPDPTIGPGVLLIDDQAARYAELDAATIVGLVETDWPDRPRRNIFYAPPVLNALGWPSEQDRRAAADARFLDLLASPSRHVTLSTFTLDDEAIVTRALLLDEVPRARLTTVTEPASRPARESDEAGSIGASGQGAFDWDAPPAPPSAVAEPPVPPETASWLAFRRSRASADAAEFHGSTGTRARQTWSVSALEAYAQCPFKFFSQYVLKLQEEPDDEEVMDPRRQGQFVHEVFEEFFKQWQAEGRGAIAASDIETARAKFEAIVEVLLQKLPEGEAGLERTRLLGSSVAAGLGEAVFRMEAERPVPVLERLLEHKLHGAFTFATDKGARTIDLRGKADRIDLLADGTFRLIDYKLGWPPDKGRALQLPIYGLCAEQQLSGRGGRRWTLGEAVYLAFKGPKRVVPLFAANASRDEVLARAQQRLSDTLDAIERGDFPPTPDDVYRCDTCTFAPVCRKDYVGSV